jgi:hypothetical protein
MDFIDKQWHWEPGDLDTCKMPGLHISTAQGSVEVKQYNTDMIDVLADIAYEQEQAMREQWDEPMEDLDDPYHWSAAKATKYSSDDETAMAAFNYSSDSSEADRWR